MKNDLTVRLLRLWYLKYAVIGIVYTNDWAGLYSLENKEKIIPAGEYDVELTYSKKFSSEFPYRYFYFVPLLKNVPKRKGIRIHIGDYYRDCSGSILLGKSAYIPTESVDKSTFAYESFMHYIWCRNVKKFKLIIEEKDSGP
jgi:hypothetical protein